MMLHKGEELEKIKAANRVTDSIDHLARLKLDGIFEGSIEYIQELNNFQMISQFLFNSNQNALTIGIDNKIRIGFGVENFKSVWLFSYCSIRINIETNKLKLIDILKKSMTLIEKIDSIGKIAKEFDEYKEGLIKIITEFFNGDTLDEELIGQLKTNILLGLFEDKETK